MCTVTYLPLAKGAFILTSNRDESPKRGGTKFPVFKKYLNRNIIFPQDLSGKGTWIASSDDGVSIALMNGANGAHVHNPPYRMSRGLVLLEALECIKPSEFIKNFDFSDIEPFTMIIVVQGSETVVTEFKWDGTKKYTKKIDAKTPQIWSSEQLYSKDQMAKRDTWFKNWLAEKPDFKLESIREFHRTTGDGNPLDQLVMDRQIVKTVSITSIFANNSSCQMVYDDFSGKGDRSFEFSQELHLELTF